MRMGMVGLGRMGANMTRRLIKGGHEVVVHDVVRDAVAELVKEKAEESASLENLVEKLDPPRVIWIMVPSGDITAQTVEEVGALLSEGDVLIDGGNSRFTDSQERAAALAHKGVSFLDAGTSGGIWGLEGGFCLMVGGEESAFKIAEPVFKTLAPEGGYAYVGPSGAGHFTKMVHNGVEYALMQAYGEGFELLENSEFDLDLAQIAELWRYGSVIRSWMLDLASRALAEDPHLEALSDYVEDSGEGRWTAHYAIDHAIPIPTIAMSLFNRFASRQEASFALKFTAALRHQFGGHAVKEATKP